MTLWLGKRWNGGYEFGDYKKYWNFKNGFGIYHCKHSFYTHRFEKATSIKLKPGEIRKIKSIMIVLEKR